MAALELEVVAISKEIRDLIFRMSLPSFGNNFLFVFRSLFKSRDA
jgi:hypothetical protein